MFALMYDVVGWLREVGSDELPSLLTGLAVCGESSPTHPHCPVKGVYGGASLPSQSLTAGNLALLYLNDSLEVPMVL